MKPTDNSTVCVLTVLAGLAVTAALTAGCGGSTSTSPQTGGTPTTATGTVTGRPGTPGPTATAAETETPSAGSSSATAAGIPRCHTRDLVGSFSVVGSAGMGNIVYKITLTNTTPHSCTLYGYPGLLLLDVKHAALPTNVLWMPDPTKHLITLAPGASASASDRFTLNVPSFGDNTALPPGGVWVCQPTAVYIQITPPDETTHLVVKVTRRPRCARAA